MSSILDRYKEFIARNPDQLKPDQTRLIFLQPDLVDGVRHSIQLHGILRPGSSIKNSPCIHGMLISPFLESEVQEGETQPLNQPFFLGEPFPITWIEAAGDEILGAIKPEKPLEKAFLEISPKIQEEKMQLIRAIWLWRSHPDSYCAVLIGDNGYALATIISEESDDESSYLLSPVHAFLFRLFQKLARHGQLGNERVNERFKVGSGQGKQVVKIKDIIHIRMKRKQDHSQPGESQNIEWSHRWEVMGHWRKITGIGKDDQGRYHVNGFTWVLPHTKGPEEKELVKKTRIYLGPKNLGGAA
jgi:hypothetical protein